MLFFYFIAIGLYHLPIARVGNEGVVSGHRLDVINLIWHTWYEHF